MAIDDNTSYELTGAQVKDLANKIKGKAADNTFVGATSAAPGSKGLVPEPQAGDDTKFLSGDGTWQTVPTVNNGALTIQQNGTTLNTFTANSSDDKTVNIQTITAETVAPAEEVGAITASMIDWTTMKHWVPDYSNMQDLGRISSYTAQETGWVFARVYGYSASSTYETTLSVNGVSVYYDSVEATSGSGTRSVNSGVMIPVSAGDVVTGMATVNAGPTNKFIPGKWA